MTKQEFETRTGTKVTDGAFFYINRVYMAAGEMDKDAFCKDWRDEYVSKSKIVSYLTSEVESTKGSNEYLRSEFVRVSKGLHDFTDQMVDFLIIQAEKWSASDLREKAIKMVGIKEYIRRKLEMKFGLWEADRQALLEIISK